MEPAKLSGLEQERVEVFFQTEGDVATGSWHEGVVDVVSPEVSLYMHAHRSAHAQHAQARTFTYRRQT